jgi:hypothetical protein
MKKAGKVILVILIIGILGVVSVIASLGYIPGLSALFGANKPKNLGVIFSDTDLTSARAKSKIIYGMLPDSTPIEQSIQRVGQQKANFSLTSAEVTALLNNRPWKYWPVKDVQLKINDDGSAELSCVVVKEKLRGFAIANGIPASTVDLGLKFIPPDPAVYLKATTALTDNKVSQFDIQSVYLGKFSLPVDKLLSFTLPRLIKPVYASGSISDLYNYSGKREIIINFINERLSKIQGFFAKNANFKGGKLNFDGMLSEKELTTR